MAKCCNRNNNSSSFEERLAFFFIYFRIVLHLCFFINKHSANLTRKKYGKLMDTLLSPNTGWTFLCAKHGNNVVNGKEVAGNRLDGRLGLYHYDIH